jgi:hypothetical protein
VEYAGDAAKVIDLKSQRLTRQPLIIQPPQICHFDLNSAR